METMDRFMGAMTGSAVGDALGFLIEFMTMKNIQKKYGPYGLRTILKLECNGKKGIISDDTQMALFTADGLLWAQHGQEPLAAGIHRSLMRWYYTQTERIVRPEQAGWNRCQDHERQYGYDMMAEKDLFARRSPGKACLVSLATGTQFTLDQKPNQCKGSTVLSRAIPIGLWFAGDPERAFATAMEAAVLTHGHPHAYYAAATLGAIISLLSVGKEESAAFAASLRLLQDHPDGIDVLKAVLHAVDEAVTDRNPVRAMKKIGLGWKAEEALALGVYCLLKTSSLKDAVIMACNQDGDSDTCGAVTGAMTGALYGVNTIPKNWRINLECLPLLQKLTGLMYERHAQETTKNLAPAL